MLVAKTSPPAAVVAVGSVTAKTALTPEPRLQNAADKRPVAIILAKHCAVQLTKFRVAPSGFAQSQTRHLCR